MIDHFWLLRHIQKVLGPSFWISGSCLFFFFCSSTASLQVRTITYSYQAWWSAISLILKAGLRYFLRKVYTHLRDRKMCVYKYVSCVYASAFVQFEKAHYMILVSSPQGDWQFLLENRIAKCWKWARIEEVLHRTRTSNYYI